MAASNRKGVTDTTGEAVSAGAGGLVGAASGAAIGTAVGGPIGTIIGGLAGAVGGWWGGRAIAEAATTYTDDDDRYYQSHYQAARGSTTSEGYEQVRPAYQLGHLAGANPDYRDRDFNDVEPHLSSAYGSSGYNDWDDVRDYARDAYSRGREAGATRRDGLGDDGLRTSSTGRFDADRTTDLREGGLADRAADTVDDLKDRVDGNPGSRPGRDNTDRPGR